MVNKRGYTLIEILIVTAILGIVALIGPQLLLQVNRFFILGRVRVELQQEARVAIGLMSRNLRQSQSNTIKIDQVAGQPYYSRVTFTKIQGTTVTYYQSGTKLLQAVGSNIKTLSENARYLAFTFPRSDDMSIISVSLTLEKAIYERKLKALHVASEKIRVMD